jgi:hypothetical protein
LGGVGGASPTAGGGGQGGDADGSAAGAGGRGGTAGSSSGGREGGAAGAAGIGGPTPLLRWTFDGDGTNTGTVAGYPLSLTGAVIFVAGKFGQAAQFGAGAYGMVQGSARAVMGVYPQYTISFWVNATSSPDTAQPLFDFYNRTTAPFGGIRLGYASSALLSRCVATSTNKELVCVKDTFSEAGRWRNMIIRYAGTSTTSGGGAPVEIYYDGHIAARDPNDANNDPVFNPGISDALYIGAGGIMLDDVRIYNTVFTTADQCTEVIGGSWDGTACTLP